MAYVKKIISCSVYVTDKGCFFYNTAITYYDLYTTVTGHMVTLISAEMSIQFPFILGNQEVASQGKIP